MFEVLFTTGLNLLTQENWKPQVYQLTIMTRSCQYLHPNLEKIFKEGTISHSQLTCTQKERKLLMLYTGIFANMFMLTLSLSLQGLMSDFICLYIIFITFDGTVQSLRCKNHATIVSTPK